MSGILYPSLLLALALLGLSAALAGLHARMLRGMGQGPMSSLSRATCPTQGASAGLARQSIASQHLPHGQGAARRVSQRSDGSRSAAPAHPWPFLALERQAPAAGAPHAVHGRG